MMSATLGKRFWLVWSASTFANLGDGLTIVAFPLLAKSVTDDARLIALVTTFRFLPFALLGLPAGLIIDRFDRLKLAILAQWIRVAAMGTLCVTIWSGQQSITWLVTAAFMVGVGEILTDGGLPAIVRDLVRVDQLEKANARLFSAQVVTNSFVGPPIAAVLFSFNHLAPFVAATSVFIATSIALYLVPGSFVPRRTQTESPPEPLTRQLLVGLRYVWGHRVLRPLALAVGVFSFVGQAGNAVEVLVITDAFGFSDTGFGALVGLTGVASLITSFFVVKLVIRVGHSASMKLSVAAYATASLLFGFGSGAPVAIGAAVLMGVSDPTWNVVSGTIRQRLVPDEIFGRMLTAYLFIAWGVMPAGAYLGGVIANRFGPTWVFVVSGLTVGSLLVIAQPMFKSVDRSMKPVDSNT